MRQDIVTWCRTCVTCATRRVGRAIRPPLIPLPVAGAFNRIGVDIIQFVLLKQGNKYAVVFIDYLTKWVEAFTVPDQTALTIAKLLVEQVITWHGVPQELLLDRGANFLSTLIQQVCDVMGVHEINTTAYHPQGDGLVERFNRTLQAMLSKTVERSGRDWDKKFPFVLFAYRTSVQDSTQESPFLLLYGRDPHLSSEEALSPPVDRSEINLESYGSELVVRMSEAWELAQRHIKKAQRRQKTYHDRNSRSVPLQVGDRVSLHVPAAKQGRAHKFAHPFRGPYRVIELYKNGADIRPVGCPLADTIRATGSGSVLLKFTCLGSSH